MSQKKVLIVAGEPSGDLHASNLVRELKRSDQDLEFFGMGGRGLRKAGVDITFDMANLALIGVTEVLKNIFTIREAYAELLTEIDRVRPCLAILVDYPGFNLRLAKELERRNIPIIYYISPQVWAWGENRIETIKRYVKKVIVFFKFEEVLYKRHGVDVECVGHPFLDIVKASSSEGQALSKYGLSEEGVKIALLPGSRIQEVRLLLPIMVAACDIVKRSLKEAEFIIAKHKDLPLDLYKKAVKGFEVDIKIGDGDTYNILNIADFAIVASGSATLECAIMGVPFVIIYKTSFLTYLLYRLVSKVRFLGLVNIIAGRQIVPELLQSNAAPRKIADKIMGILSDELKISAILEGLKSVKPHLGESGSSSRAAKAVLHLL